MKYVFYFAIIITIAYVCIGLFTSEKAVVEEVAKPEIRKPLQLTIEFGERREPFSDSIESGGGITVFDLLKSFADRKLIHFDYSGSGETVFIKAIGGVVGGEGDNPWWVYLVNGQLANEGCGMKRVGSGDHVVWRLGKYPE